MHAQIVGQRIQAKLNAAEAKLAEAQQAYMELLSETMAARGELALAPTVGAEEQAAIARAVAAMGSAHEETAKAHKGFEKLARAMGIRTKGVLNKPMAAAEDRVAA